jgi:type II secretory pathway pseudopilin PulG
MSAMTVFSILGILVMFLLVLGVVQERSRKRKQAIQAALALYERTMRTTQAALQTDPLLLNNAFKEVIYGRMQRAQDGLRFQGVAVPKVDVRQVERGVEALHIEDVNPFEDQPALPIDDRGRKALLRHVKWAKMFLQNEIKQRSVSGQTLNEAITHVNQIEMGLHLSVLIDRGKLALDRDLLGGARESFESAQTLLNDHADLAAGFTEHRQIIEQNLQRIKELMRANAAPHVAPPSEDGLPDFAIARGGEITEDDDGDGLDRMFGMQRTHWK